MYFDTTYLVRLYVNEPGAEAVRQLADSGMLTCCVLGQAEAFAAFHRMLREGRLTASEHRAISDNFAADCEAGVVMWRRLSTSLVDEVRELFASLPSTVFLRSADAVHLICAKDAGLGEIYSNDTHLLRAAPAVGLRGVNVI